MLRIFEVNGLFRAWLAAFQRKKSL